MFFPLDQDKANLANLRAMAERTLGREWMQRLARALGVNVRSVQRWATGQRGVHPAALEWLSEQSKTLDATKLDADIEAVTEAAMRTGQSPHVVIGLLRDRADRLAERYSDKIEWPEKYTVNDAND